MVAHHDISSLSLVYHWSISFTNQAHTSDG